MGVTAGLNPANLFLMSKLAVGTGAVVLAAGAAAVYLQHQANLQLRQEVALLREEIRQSSARGPAMPATRDAGSAAPVATGTPLASANELTQLRGDIASLRKSADEIVKFTQFAQAAAAAKSLQNADSTVPVNLIPAGALKNAGRSTPEASTETALWAAVAGEVDALANTMVFTPSARTKADAWFASLSDSTRQQYGSPEKVIALMIAKDAAGLSGMQVIGQKEITPDDVGVRVRMGSVNGGTKEDTLVMHRVGNGWSMLLNDQVVEKFAQRVGGRK